MLWTVKFSHLLIIIGTYRAISETQRALQLNLKKNKNTMRKYTSVQNIKINKHFHTKHGKNTSNI